MNQHNFSKGGKGWGRGQKGGNTTVQRTVKGGWLVRVGSGKINNRLVHLNVFDSNDCNYFNAIGFKSENMGLSKTFK